MTRYNFRDKVCVITGGSRGLGLVMARELAACGAKIAICARDTEELERAAEDLASRGADVFAMTCDITNRDQIGMFVAEIHEVFGGIHVLVNNAGVIDVGPMEHMTFFDFDRALATHFWGPLYMMDAVIPEMRERGEGRIVNIASIGGKVAVPHLLPYTASKYALVGLSEGMHAELAKDGIAVTTAIPGLMRTGSPLNASFRGQHRKEYALFAIADSLPLTSMRAERAARKIIKAARAGKPEVVVGLQAKLAIALGALAPNLVQRALGLVNRMLPGPGGIRSHSAIGRDSASSLAPSILTLPTERAAIRNNEV
jgi:NAD(P)-dependent dehydrogenase (short-subunit alcohol dehydrogenase family)